MRGLKAPLSGSEINELVGLAALGQRDREIAPAIRKRLLTLDLIAETGNGVELTATGQMRALSELKTARGEKHP